MARARSKSPVAKPRTSQQIERALLFERLRGPVFPGVIAALLILGWVLVGAGALAPAPVVTAVGGLLLLLLLFFGLRDFLDDRTPAARAAILVAFAGLWAAGTFFPYERAVNLRPALATHDLQPGGAPWLVPLGGVAGRYRVVVEGHFPSTEERASQSIRYDLGVQSGSAPEQTFSGNFTEKWGSQRLGRRGSAPVHLVRSVAQHTVDAPGGEDLKVRLEELSPPRSEAITVHVHPDGFPTLAVVGIGIALTAAAFVVDLWRLELVPGADGLMTIFTLASLFTIAALRRFAPPQPGLGDLVFNGAIGAVGGWLGGIVLWNAGKRWR